MRTLMPVIALSLGAVVANYLTRPAAAEDNPVKLKGEYTIVSGERDGRPIPEEKIKGSLVKFTDDRIVGTDKERKEFFAATYTLDTTTSPWVISMKSTAPKDSETKGIIKRDGDKIVIAYALPGGTAPKEFKTKEKQHLFTLKMNK